MFTAKQAQDALEASQSIQQPVDEASSSRNGNLGITVEHKTVTKSAETGAEIAESPETATDQAAPGPSRRHPRPVRQKEKDRQPAPLPDDHQTPLKRPEYLPDGFCEQCFIPLPDDPDPETLFIYLHALRYTTERLGTWETPLPRWAGAKWDGDWRGWAEPNTSVYGEEGGH